MPTDVGKGGFYQEFKINFSVRIACDQIGNIELLIAEKGVPRHFKYSLEGLNANQARKALLEFVKQMTYCNLPTYFYCLALACYTNKDENIIKKNEIYDEIISSFETRFWSLLKWRGDRIVEQKEENGVVFTTYESIEGGRPKGTKNKTPSITIEQIKEKISKFKSSATFPTQTIIARKLRTSERTIQRCLKKAGIKLKYNDFAHSILNPN